MTACDSVVICSGDYYGMFYRCRNLNTSALKIPLASFVPSSVRSPNRTTPYAFSNQDCLTAAMAQAAWGQFCTPPILDPKNVEEPFILDSQTEKTGSRNLGLYQGRALGGQFTPNSPDIAYIAFGDVVGMDPTASYILEIRSDSGGRPLGSPGDGNFLAQSVFEIPVAKTVDCGGNHRVGIGSYNIVVPVNAILPAAGVPYWVVVYSSDFICSGEYVGDSFYRAKFSHYQTLSQEFPNEEDRKLAVSVGGLGCGWTLNSAYGNLCFAVYSGSGLPTCSIQSSHFTKNGDANFDCGVQPGDALAIDVMVSGLGMYFVMVEYLKPDGTKNTLQSEPHYLNNEQKIWSMPVPDVVPGTYRITQVAVFDNDTSMEKCSAVY